MRKLLYLPIILMLRCTSHNPSATGVVTINVADGLKETRELKLSEFVRDIEYIKLETKKECLIGSGYPIVGRDHILILSYNPLSVLLFSREGKFLATIGKKGQGPGEFMTINQLTFTSDEKAVFLLDAGQKRFLLYDLNGNIIKETGYQHFINGSIRSVLPDPVYGFTAFLNRPYEETHNFPIILKLNDAFEIVDRQFPVSVDLLASQGYIIYKSSLYYRDKQLHFREFNMDTLYIREGKDIRPTYFFNIPTRNPNRVFTAEQNQEEFNFINRTLEQGPMIFIGLVMNKLGKSFTVCYNKEIKEIFTLKDIPVTSLSPVPRPGFVNDLDGTPSPEFLENNQEFNTIILDILSCKEWLEKDFDPTRKISLPRRQKQFTDLIRVSAPDDNPILQIMHLR